MTRANDLKVILIYVNFGIIRMVLSPVSEEETEAVFANSS